MTDLDLHADDLRRALDDLAGTVRPSTDDAWARLLPRLSAVGDTGASPDDDGPAEPEATVVELDAYVPRARRHHRSRFTAVAAVAAAVLVAGLVVVLPRIGRDVAADGAAPWLLLPSSETRLQLRQATISPAETSSGYVVVVADADVTTGFVVRAEPGAEQSFAAATARGDITTLTVHGEQAQLFGQSLWWNEAGTGLSITSLDRPVDLALLQAVADGVKLAGDGTPTATVVPDGMAVRAAGPEATLLPAARYTVDYGAENLDAPFDDSLQLSVVEGATTPAVLAMLAALAPGPVRTVDVRGHRAVVRQATVDETTTVAVAWQERPGVHVTAVAFGLTEDEVLALVRAMRSLDQPSWQAAAGVSLVDTGSSAAATTAPAGPPVASGQIDGETWTVRHENAGDPSITCLTLATAALEAGGCGERLGRIAVVGSSVLTGGNGSPTVWSIALVADDVARVEVVDRDGTVVTRADRVEATGVGGLVVLRYPVDDGAEVVAYDRAGARLTAQVLPNAATSAPVPLGGFPDFEAIAGLPTLASGTLGGRPWQARGGRVRLVQAQADGSQAATGEDTVCASVDYAKRTQLAFTCENDGAGVPGFRSLGATTTPRTFMVGLTEAGIERVTVGWADGTESVVDVAPLPGDDFGVVVVPVPRGSRVVSLATSAGRATVDVSGEADSSPTLPATAVSVP